jgi:hypothetical protein
MTWHKDVQEAKKAFSQFEDGDSVNECFDDEQEYWNSYTIIGENNQKTVSQSITKKRPAEEACSEEEEVDYWDQYDVDMNKSV